jgi:hypothetical protein
VDFSSRSASSALLFFSFALDLDITKLTLLKFQTNGANLQNEEDRWT